MSEWFDQLVLAAPGAVALSDPEPLTRRKIRARSGSGSVSSTTNGERDRAWVEATLNGERTAFEPLVTTYEKAVFAVLYRYLRNEADTADLTQRTFITAYEKLGQLRNPDAFAAWLFQIAVNLAKNQLRFKASKTFEEIDESLLISSPQAETELVKDSERRELRRALDRLPPKQRQCVALRIDADLSFKEIGRSLGMTELSARVNYHHGLKALRCSMGGPEGHLKAETNEVKRP